MSSSRSPISPSDLSGTSLLRLARRSREVAREKLRALEVAAQARACLELRPEVRSEFLMLLDNPEEVVPLFPEAEVCLTIRASGMSEGAWLLEIATPDQRQACFDLDCWSDETLEIERVLDWVDALIEAGPDILADSFGDIDPELWVLVLRSLAEVAVLSKEELPPPGWVTVDGVVYWGPRDGVELTRIQQIAQSLFGRTPARYWQMVYGLLFESPAECEEYAFRWRAGRLADLGFPEREHAMSAYRPLRPEDAAVWEYAPDSSAVVESPSLPRQLQGTLLGEALSKLPPGRGADVFGYVLAVANAIAVADRLRLSDTDSIPAALEKTVRGIDLGLRELAKLRRQPAEDVLDRTPPMDLFRIGVTLDRALRER